MRSAPQGASLYCHGSLKRLNPRTTPEQYLDAPTYGVRYIDSILILSARAVPAAERCWMSIFFNESRLAFILLCSMYRNHSITHELVWNRSKIGTRNTSPRMLGHQDYNSTSAKINHNITDRLTKWHRKVTSQALCYNVTSAIIGLKTTGRLME
jgi:hypothetical protein